MKQGVLFKVSKERPPAKQSPVRPFLEGLGFTHLTTNKSGSFFELRLCNRIRCHSTEARMVIIVRRGMADHSVLVDSCSQEHVRQEIEIVVRQINSARHRPQSPPMPPEARAGWGPSPR